MLTENDESNDGFSHKYLTEPEKWRKYDPDLFDFFKHYTLKKNEKSINHLENSGLLKNTDFFSRSISDKIELREQYFDQVAKIAKKQNYDLLFFEIDNGIEVKSVRKGRKNSSK